MFSWIITMGNVQLFIRVGHVVLPTILGGWAVCEAHIQLHKDSDKKEVNVANFIDSLLCRIPLYLIIFTDRHYRQVTSQIMLHWT